MSNVENVTAEQGSDAQDQLLAQLLQRFSQNTANAQPTQPTSAPNTAQAPTGDILSSLLSNTDLLSKLPQVISAIKPIFDIIGKQSSSEATPSPQPTEQAVSANALPAFPASEARHKSDADRAALLCAMKPYLSPSRRNAIDYIIKLSRLGDILKTL